MEYKNTINYKCGIDFYITKMDNIFHKLGEVFINKENLFLLSENKYYIIYIPEYCLIYYLGNFEKIDNS